MDKVLVKGALFAVLLFTCTATVFADTGDKKKNYFSFEGSDIVVEDSAKTDSADNDSENKQEFEIYNTDKTITVYNPEYITTETRQKKIVRTLQEKFNFTKQQKIAIEIVFGLLVVIIALALRKMIRK